MQAEQFYSGDRRFDDALFAVPKGKRAMEAEQVVVNSGDPGREMWVDKQEEQEQNLLNVKETASVFYSDFPLPDFRCMSSSSSSSSTHGAVKATTCSSSSSSSASLSSSAASWAVLKFEDTATANIENRKNSRRSDHCENNSNRFCQHAGEADAPSQALSSTASMKIILEPPVDQASTDAVGSFIDSMDTFGYMDLLESNDFFDPASLFQGENLLEEFLNQEREAKLVEQQNHLAQATAAEADSRNRTGPVSDEMGAVLLEWLTENKDNISADDLRRIKIKKATVETAAKRLGGGREAMKQLLKLILQWVKANHLHKKRLKESASVSASQLPHQYQEPFHHHQNPNPNLGFSPEPNGLQPPSFHHQPQWIALQPPYVACPAPMMEVQPPQPGYGPAPGYMGDPAYCHGAPPDHLSGNPFPPEYQMINSAQPWRMSQFSVASQPHDYQENFYQPPQAHGLRGYQHHQYPFQYYNGHGQRLVRLGSSATKEARKKRMARQRRFFSHHRSSHHHHHHTSNQQGNHQSMAVAAEQHARLGVENCAIPEAAHPAHNHQGSWVYWPSPANAGPVAAPPPLLVVDPVQVAHPTDRPAMQPQNYQRQVVPERRQGWKPENNLKFLLQKVLKQSDVGNLGRIVLPKKEAETYLPELEARDGISIAMEDIGTSKVWNMRYRFWPNNKSRMYLLENTGDFVRANGLEEGDFIVIYSDVKCGKYLIRGVKVRQPEGTKLENHKRPEKSQRNVHASSSQKE